jgi:heme exporter protein D
MKQIIEWLSMGGYSLYIWPAYGIVSVLLVMNLLGIKWQKERTFKKLQQWFKKQ